MPRTRENGRRRVVVVPDVLGWLAGTGLLVFALAFAFWVGVQFNALNGALDAIRAIQAQQAENSRKLQEQAERIAEHRTALQIGGLLEAARNNTPGR